MLTITQAKTAIEQILAAKKVPLLKGQPGAGKSSIMKQIAKEANLQFIDLRLAQCEPTDLNL